jgi:hypothetical protein
VDQSGFFSSSSQLSGRLGSGVPEAGLTGMSGPSESGCSQRELPGCNTLIHSSATVSQKTTACCVSTLHRITNTESRLLSSCSPATQLSGMIVRRARVSCDLPAVKQIEYPPPVLFPSSSFLPCTHHRLVLPTFLSLDTFVRHIALYIHFWLRIARPNTLFHPTGALEPKLVKVID